MTEEAGFHFVFGIIGLLAIVMVAVVVGGFIYLGITSMPTYREVPPMVVDVVPIYSLNFGQSVQGNFLLGSGVVESKSVYYYYIKLNDGGLVLSNVPTDYSIIYMDSENNTANIVISSMDSVTCSDKQSDVECAKKYTWRKSYAVHVPPNTVRKEFDGNP